MQEHLASLAAWESFYVIVGSSAAALTGLQFVVMTLVADAERPLGSTETTAAFGTPTVVHFCAALLISAVLSAPWHRLSGAGWVMGIAGAAGLVYVALVIGRARHQNRYQPVLEDWIWHVTLPLVAYAALIVSSLRLPHHYDSSLFVIGGVALLLLFIGIHNSWDTVTYIAIVERRGGRNQRPGT